MSTKAVDKLTSAEAEKELRARGHVSAEQREHNEHKQSLMLSRALILSRIQASHDPRYRAQLKGALEQLDAQLRELDGD